MQTQEQTYSPEGYLALEDIAEFRSEYHDGEIIPMTGGSTNHNEIVTNLIALLKPGLRQQNWRFYCSDVRLWIPHHRRFTYPDVMGIPGEPVYYQGRTDTVLNPALIIEVLSKSTEDYDRQDKFRYYRSLSSLQEYVLIDQYETHIEQFTKREDGLWLLRDYEANSQRIQFSSIPQEVAISDLYEGVVFDLSPLEAGNAE